MGKREAGRVLEGGWNGSAAWGNEVARGGLICPAWHLAPSLLFVDGSESVSA